jgi:uncharacterized protein (TIGR03066 family)
MVRALFLAVAVAIIAPTAARAADDDILGKWELTEEAAGIPKGSTFEFKKDGTLVVTATVGGMEKEFKFKYELKGKVLKIVIGDKADTTEVTKLTATELVCKDADGTTAKFKKVK